MIKDFKTRIKEKSDKELMDIYLNADNYQPEFIKHVEEELSERKIPVESLKLIKETKDELSNEKLELGIQGNQFWIVAFFIAALLGGVVSIFAGYNYAYSKKRNAKGIEFFVYNESTRKYGHWMMIIGGLCILIYIEAKILHVL